MPIYEYRCTSCGHELEALQKLSDPRLTECPACHAAALTKKVSAAGFQLKGSGWYATDFRNSGAKQPAKDGAAKTGDKANGAETKPEAKSGDGASTESTTTTTKTSGTAGATESKSTTTSTADKTGT
jgi:putative FmdB family regulatory protein